MKLIQTARILIITNIDAVWLWLDFSKVSTPPPKKKRVKWTQIGSYFGKNVDFQGILEEKDLSISNEIDTDSSDIDPS